MPRRYGQPFKASLALGLILLLPLTAFAADRVIVSSGSDGATQRTLTGAISDYNGKELKIDLTTGQAVTIPATRVAEVQATWNAAHVEGDRLLAEHKFAEALDAYRQAVSQETRDWAKRRIFAQAVTCYESLGQFDRAGDTFVLVIQSDEHWQYFERIPLAWTSSLTDATLAAKASAWLAADDAPLALLGASWSLAGEQRATAMATLRKLSTSTDPRIAHLADAQMWRANIATVGPQELLAWETQIERMPANLRSGPYLVLGKGWVQQDARMLGPAEAMHRRAAWAFLKPPMLSPERPAHAAEGLLLAADPLTKLGWDDETAIVLREVAHKFPRSEAGRTAAERLKRQAGAKPR